MSMIVGNNEKNVGRVSDRTTQKPVAQSAGAVEYTDSTSVEGKTPPMRVLDTTLNNLIVRFQWYWSYGECAAPLYCHCSQVHSGPEW